MAWFTFRWNRPFTEIIKNLGFGKKLNLFYANTAYKKMYDYIPYETGALADTVDISATASEAKIDFKTPYARRLYYGKSFNFSTEKHALATAEWDKAMMKAKAQELANEVNEYRKTLRRF